MHGHFLLIIIAFVYRFGYKHMCPKYSLFTLYNATCMYVFREYPGNWTTDWYDCNNKKVINKKEESCIFCKSKIQRGCTQLNTILLKSYIR